jgi:hypothetical protein
MTTILAFYCHRVAVLEKKVRLKMDVVVAGDLHGPNGHKSRRQQECSPDI